jgi:hypothetical protein
VLLNGCSVTSLTFTYGRRHNVVFACAKRKIFGTFAQTKNYKKYIVFSVADPGCLSRIPDPDFYPSRIPDPGSKNSNKKEGCKKKFCHTFLCSHKCLKIENYFSFEVLKKKFGPIFKEIWNFLPKKLSLSSQKYGFGIRDPGSGKKLFPDPGSRGQKGTGSRIRIRNIDCFTAYFDDTALFCI